MGPRYTTTFDQTDCLLAPGEMVEQSGIYEICHQDEPRATVILMRNTIFPYCRRCGERVRYKVLELIPHISEDPDFQEDAPGTDNPSHKMMILLLRSPCNLVESMDFDSSRKLYKPGQVVPSAGIYKVLHAEHRLPHKAAFKAREKFPACSKCASLVRFELLMAAGDGVGNGKGK